MQQNTFRLPGRSVASLLKPSPSVALDRHRGSGGCRTDVGAVF